MVSVPIIPASLPCASRPNSFETLLFQMILSGPESKELMVSFFPLRQKYDLDEVQKGFLVEKVCL